MRTITAERLRTATSVSDVVELAREYLSEWLPEEIGRLPADCRPGKLRDAEDLSDLTFNLTQACVSFDLDARDVALVEEMDAFIAQACRRIAEIQSGIRIPANSQQSTSFARP